MTDKTKEQLALELWREWFVWDGDPTYTRKTGGDPNCFFCGAIFFKGEGKHLPGCIFIRAKQLIEKE